jgi:predicted NBD/HSP70 family sugar kinase
MKLNQSQVKVNNKTLVLNTIKENLPLSRADISEKLGLTKGTISSLVKELLDEQLCYESGPGISSGGRRPILLNFNEKAGFSIGIDLGVNYILGILTDFSGNIINQTKTEYHETDYTQVLQRIMDSIAYLIKNAPNSHYGVVGIGIGVPGIVDIEGEEIILAPNLKWKNKKIKQDIEQFFNLPVIVENEANVGAYGEKLYGLGKDFENIIYISAGVGLGVGLILNGKIYKGAQGFSGEMGHTIINVDGPHCECGSKGCWETYASEKYIFSRMKDIKISTVAEELSIDSLLLHAKENNHIAQIFNDAGKYLGVGINNIINTFDPEQIIIGNSLAKAKKYLDGPITELIYNNTLKYNKKNLQIDYTDGLSSSTVLGASAYVTEMFLYRGVGSIGGIGNTWTVL